MPSPLTFFVAFVGGFMLLSAVFIILGIRQKKSRASEWRRVAAEMGFSYQERCGSISPQFKFASFFYDLSRVSNLVQRDVDGVWIGIMDYRPRKRRNRGPTQTICLLRSNRLALPLFFLQPEILGIGRAFGTLLGGLGGYVMIELTEDPEFKNAYSIQGQDEAAVQALFNAKVRHFFQTHRDRNYVVGAEGQALYFHHRNRRLGPAQARDMLEEAIELHNLLAGIR